MVNSFLRWFESFLLFFSPENSWVFQNLDLYKEKFKQLRPLRGQVSYFKTTLRTDRNFFLFKFVLYFFFSFFEDFQWRRILIFIPTSRYKLSLSHTNWHTLEKVASHKFIFITQYLIHVHFNIINNCHDRNPIVLSRHKISYSSSSRELGLLEKIRDRARRELEKESKSIVLIHLYLNYNPDPLLIGVQLVTFCYTNNFSPF